MGTPKDSTGKTQALLQRVTRNTACWPLELEGKSSVWADLCWREKNNIGSGFNCTYVHLS
jgi:hypothetical protein